jgi:hypothetical protein
MNEIIYDVVIRTVGRGGEKYASLLKSIQNLVPQPQKIWVVLPEDGTEPPNQIGSEKFIYASKGMMTQRLAILNEETAPYLLFCDDDIQFEEDFVRKLHRAVTEYNYQFATGEVLAFLPHPKGMKHYLPILHASAIPSKKNKGKYVRILKSSGWTYNRFNPQNNLVMETESAAGCMFYTSVESFRNLCFEDELWAQHGTVAPADDQIMFYKAYLMGKGVCVVTDAHYDHLNAKASTASDESKRNKAYWSGFNRAVFWHRFIFSVEANSLGKIEASLAFEYYCMMNAIHLVLRGILKPKERRMSVLHIRGIIDGIMYTRSEEYKSIPKIRI